MNKKDKNEPSEKEVRDERLEGPQPDYGSERRCRKGFKNVAQ